MNIAARGGPRTKAGKKISSKNALKHGLTGLHFISTDEQARYELLIEMLQEEYSPKTITEDLYLSRIASTQIRLERIINAEQAEVAIAQKEITYGTKVIDNLNIAEEAKTQFLINDLAGLYKEDSVESMKKLFFQNILAQQLHNLMAQGPINDYEQIINNVYLLHLYLRVIALHRNMPVSKLISHSSDYDVLINEIINIPNISEEESTALKEIEINEHEISSNALQRFIDLIYKKILTISVAALTASHFEQTKEQYLQAAMPDPTNMDRFMRYSTNLSNQLSKAIGELRHIIKERKAAEITITDK